MAVVRLEREVELYCVLRVGQDAAIHDASGCRGHGAEATYWSTATGSSPQPALSFPPLALASPACGVQYRRSWCGGGESGAREGEGLDVAIGLSGGSAGAAAATRGGGTAMAGVCGGGWERAGHGGTPGVRRPERSDYHLISYSTTWRSQSHDVVSCQQQPLRKFTPRQRPTRRIPTVTPHVRREPQYYTTKEPASLLMTLIRRISTFLSASPSAQ